MALLVVPLQLEQTRNIFGIFQTSNSVIGPVIEVDAHGDRPHQYDQKQEPYEGSEILFLAGHLVSFLGRIIVPLAVKHTHGLLVL